jgi:hypothetical protein
MMVDETWGDDELSLITCSFPSIVSFNGETPSLNGETPSLNGETSFFDWSLLPIDVNDLEGGGLSTRINDFLISSRFCLNFNTGKRTEGRDLLKQRVVMYVFVSLKLWNESASCFNNPVKEYWTICLGVNFFLEEGEEKEEEEEEEENEGVISK